MAQRPSQQNSTNEILSARPAKLFELPELPYAFDALQPSIDATTMKVHHDGHHRAYVEKLNEAMAGAEFAPASLEDILSRISAWPTAVRNNEGGHWNHSFFW